ncbi:hypothetical protein FSARC_7809 [Fusarium sarcochroum]|uniref:Histidine kinase n=1 Tax=Fusarium sarcochroum TaxID=1208366 RepID=A0A8H4TUI1_9HYPO|nr:hypothetical protein FSARC_7809 [Fusarium sarcochroum]
MSATQDIQITEYMRECETARYDELLRTTCRPISQMTSADISISSDAILTSLAQLATCRTMTERSMISLFDETQQYVVAEATPTTSLIPSSQPDLSGDTFWLCGSHIPRKDGICDYTLRAAEQSCMSSSPEKLPVFVVEDLVTDPRFSSSPYCRPGSLARFYAAVPIRSPGGINIGSLCVFHSSPGIEWQEEYSDVLRGLSQTVMDHLEGNRIKNTLKRSKQISVGLQKFTDRRFLRPETNLNPFASIMSRHSDTSSQKQTDSEIGPQSYNEVSPTRAAPLKIPAGQHQKIGPLNPFFEAAGIIRDSLHVDGCAFFSGDSHHFHVEPTPESRHHSEASLDRSCFSPSVTGSKGNEDGPTAQSRLPCQMLGSSFAQAGDSIPNSTRTAAGLSQLFLSHMLEKYPEGCIFNLKPHQASNVDNINTFSLEEQGVSIPQRLGDISLNEDLSLLSVGSDDSNEAAGSIQEQKELLQVFPDALSAAFVPIWDPQKGTWSIGGFMCSKTPRYEFDMDSELPFLRALGILAASEAYRLETSTTDKSKTDVLGSISHELRSPLHGITLGLELLNDAGLGSAQQNIAHMIETCCRTLLDTTEHLLDYSKVNQPTETDQHLDKVLQQSKHETGPSIRPGALPRAVRLDQIVEDVIESVYAGHSYQHISIANLFTPSRNRKHSGVEAIRQLDSMQAAEEANDTSEIGVQKQLQERNVSVFLHYDPTCSWNFRTLPGAIRRIIMNLFGNSLKYTSHGVITVSISQSQPEYPQSNEREVILVVEDTGRGISEEFLRKHIFEPFSQEDQLSTGTGLGLSFVQRITSQLGGSISITSQVDIGTKVVVSIPMTLETTTMVNGPLTSERAVTQSTCHGLRARVISSIEGSGATSSQSVLTKNPLMEKLCCDHLGMTLIRESEVEQLTPDVIILTNNGMSSSSESAASWQEMPVLVVCDNVLLVQKYESAYKSDGGSRIREFISQPLSPKKLERAMSRLMDLWAESRASPPTLMPMPLPSPSNTTSSSAPPTPCPSGVKSPLGGPLTLAEDYFQNPQFLLVEDNPINLKMLTCFMKKLKQPYRTATNGQDAVLSYKESPGHFRYILMDISMPVMDGLEATRQIRAFERYNNIPPSLVLAITGLGSESTRYEATRSGVDVFITKPVKFKELEATLKSRGLVI